MREALPVGLLIGGALGGVVGLRPALFIGALGPLIALIMTVLSPPAAGAAGHRANGVSGVVLRDDAKCASDAGAVRYG